MIASSGSVVWPSSVVVENRPNDRHRGKTGEHSAQRVETQKMPRHIDTGAARRLRVRPDKERVSPEACHVQPHAADHRNDGGDDDEVGDR